MKTNAWLILGVFLSTSLFAQQQSAPPTDTAPAAPAPATAAPAVEPEPAPAVEPAPAAPAKKKKKKKAAKAMAKRAAIEEPFVSLVAGPAVVSGKNVNVRAKAKLNSEVITRLNTGDAVTVIEQINLEKAAPDEPKQWAKIAFPSAAGVWVRASFVDANSLLVTAKKLNLRAGAGENYSVVGTLEAGTPVKNLLTQGDWMKIEAPADAYAFIAAEYLRQETGFQPNAATAAATAGTNPPPGAAEPGTAMTSPPMEATPAVAPATAPAEAPATATPVTTEPPASPAPAEVIASAPQLPAPPTPAPAMPALVVPLPPRIVSHEGVVKPTVSVQAPTDFALESIETGKLEDYLHTTTTNLDIGKYNGLHIVVTGEESIDERWTNTPVITIRRIQVVE